MHKSCAKYVQNLRTEHSITCQSSSTPNNLARHIEQTMCAHVQVIHDFFPQFSSLLSTRYFANLHPLINSFTHNPHPLLLTPPKEI
jgi:hypothetical protein